MSGWEHRGEIPRYRRSFQRRLPESVRELFTSFAHAAVAEVNSLPGHQAAVSPEIHICSGRQWREKVQRFDPTASDAHAFFFPAENSFIAVNVPKMLKVYKFWERKFGLGFLYIKSILRHEAEHNRQFNSNPSSYYFMEALKDLSEGRFKPEVATATTEKRIFHFNLSDISKKQALDLHNGILAVLEGGADVTANELANRESRSLVAIPKSSDPLYQAGFEFMGKLVGHLGIESRDKVLAFPGAAPSMAEIANYAQWIQQHRAGSRRNYSTSSVTAVNMHTLTGSKPASTVTIS